MFLKRATHKLTLMFYERVILRSKIFFFIDTEEILNIAIKKKTTLMWLHFPILNFGTEEKMYFPHFSSPQERQEHGVKILRGRC